MIKNLALCAIVACLPATPAFATDWQHVSANSTGTEIYVDADSVKQKSEYDGVYKYAWVKWDHSKDKTKKYRETKLYFKFECDGLKSGLMSFARYNASGAVISSESTEYPKMTHDIPESVGYATTEFVCRR